MEVNLKWIFDFLLKITSVSRKLGNLGNLENLGDSFPSVFNPSFLFRVKGKIENSDMRKLGIIFSRFPSFQFYPIPKIENSEISESFLLLQILTVVVT